jgi:PucR C-terminal helix-turn-helix domain
MGASDRAGAAEGIAADPFVHRVAAGLVARLDVMIEQLRTRIAVEDHYYAGATEGMREEMQRTVAEQLTQVVRALAGVEALDYDLPRRVARRRADQGVPMAALLHAYRLGGEVIWEHAVALTSGDISAVADREQVLRAANVFFSLTDRYSELIRESFEDAVRDKFRCSQQARASLLDALFDGGRESLPLTSGIARILDLPERAQFVAVAADVSEEGGDGLADIEARLRALAIRSAWRRRNERQFGIVVLDGDANAASQRLAEIVACRSKSRIGFSPYFGDLGDTAEYAALADVARAALDPLEHGVTSFDDRPLSAVVVANPEIAVRAARAVIGPLLRLDRAERSAILETLRVWRDAGGSTALAAERLFCHRNTVRNRLQRVETLTGRSLDEPLGCTEVCMALEALTLLGEEAWS